MAYGYQNQSTPQPAAYTPQPVQVPPQATQPLFPQPQGNVYNINSTLEVANVPVGAGVSVALCMPENVMFIKTMQNGNPLFYPYKIVPFTTEAEQPQESSQPPDFAAQIKELNERLSNIEKSLKKKKEADFDL